MSGTKLAIESNIMMGSHQPESPLFSYSVNLEKRIRPDHPLRRFAAALGDLDWVRQEVAHCYGRNGQVSVDPVILVKLMLLLFLEDIPSERELMARLPERLDYLWFLGYGLDDTVPNHSVLSKARARWGQELFEKLFTRTVLLCAQAGLIESKRLLVDSSLVQANASKDSVVIATPQWVAAVRQACRAQEDKLSEPAPVQGINATHVSTTDPEATLARGGRDRQSHLAYKSHRAVDEAHGVITAVQTTTGQSGDAAQLPGLLEQHQQRAGQTTAVVVGDGHYGSAQNYRHCQELGIQSHLKPVCAPRQKQGRFQPEDFPHDAGTDTLRCPAGQTLRRHNFKKSEGLIEYRIEKAALCQACSLRGQCTQAQKGRTVVLPVRHQQVRAGRDQALSEEAQESYRVRRARMEGSFADAANNHGLKRARWRGLWRQRIQDWLIAAAQNLRILMKGGRTGRPQLAPMVGPVLAGLFFAIIRLMGEAFQARTNAARDHACKIGAQFSRANFWLLQTHP